MTAAPRAGLLPRGERIGPDLIDAIRARALAPDNLAGALDRVGVAEARRYERLDLPLGRIIERYRDGETTTAIGRSLGVSDEVVRRRLIKAAVERRRPGREKGGQSP